MSEGWVGTRYIKRQIFHVENNMDSWRKCEYRSRTYIFSSVSHLRYKRYKINFNLGILELLTQDILGATLPAGDLHDWQRPCPGLHWAPGSPGGTLPPWPGRLRLASTLAGSYTCCRICAQPVAGPGVLWPASALGVGVWMKGMWWHLKNLGTPATLKPQSGCYSKLIALSIVPNKRGVWCPVAPSPVAWWVGGECYSSTALSVLTVGWVPSSCPTSKKKEVVLTAGKWTRQRVLLSDKTALSGEGTRDGLKSGSLPHLQPPTQRWAVLKYGWVWSFYGLRMSNCMLMGLWVCKKGFKKAPLKDGHSTIKNQLGKGKYV